MNNTQERLAADVKRLQDQMSHIKAQASPEVQAPIFSREPEPNKFTFGYPYRESSD